MTGAATMTVEQFRARAAALGNGDMLDCRFVCPACRSSATPRQFLEAGADPERAARECLGRVVGGKPYLKIPHRKWRRGDRCDWAAFGLFGTMVGGTEAPGQEIELPSGKRIWVFSFADELEKDL